MTVQAPDSLSMPHLPTHKRVYTGRLFALLFLYVSIAVWYSFTTPPGEGVDEIPHFDYVRFVHEEGRLPVNLEGEAIEAVMAHHPPLYYILGALLISPFDTRDRTETLQANPHFQWNESGAYGWNVFLPTRVGIGESGTLQALYLLRIANVFLGAVALIFIYRIVSVLVPSSTWAALGATALVALNPAFVFMTCTIHHDTLLTLIYSAGLYWSVRAQGRHLSQRDLLVGGILAGAAVLTKLSGATLPLAMALAIFVRPPRLEDWATRWLQFAALAAIATAVAGWWLARNVILYGDLMAWTMFERVHAHMLRPSALTWGLFAQEFMGQLSRTFWGAFGYMHILLPSWTRQVMWTVTAVALLGVGIALLRSIVRRERTQRGQLTAVGLLLVAFALHFAAFVRFAAETLGAGHGRYLFPVSATLAFVLIVGFNGFTHWRHTRTISLGIGVLMAVYAIVTPYIYVWPKYQLPASPPAAEITAANRVDAVFDQGITLLAMATSDAIVIPGQVLDVTTYWSAQADAPVKADTYVVLSLVSDDGAILGQNAFWPEISTIPAVWQDRIVANRQSFYIPPDHTTTALRVQVQVFDGPNGAALAALANGKTVVTVLELLALGAVRAVDTSAVPEPRRDEVFAETLQLTAVSLPDSVVAGRPLPVQFYWHVLATPVADYTVFIHVLDEDDQIVAQLDRPPGGGTSPTTSWQAGQTLLDSYPVEIPETLTPGNYRVRMGLYTWPDLSLQPISVEDRPVGDSLVVGNFVLVLQ